jgi:hypothetical protein
MRFSLRPSRLVALAFASFALCFAQAVSAAEPESKNPLHVDFSAEKSYESFSKYPVSWDYKDTFGVPDAQLYVVKDAESGKNVLRLQSDKSSGTLLYYKLIGKLDLNKTPIMRWRWKAAILPVGGDGRYENKDDQAIGVYIGYGRIFRKSLCYHWDTDTPVGAEGEITYSKVVKVKWFCLRNKISPLNKWMVEERNVAEDFKKRYGEVPSDVVLSICVNSEYTKSKAESYFDYIEFVPLSEAGKASPPDPVPVPQKADAKTAPKS